MSKIKQKQPRYRYDKVICEKVIDGDTIDVIIDLGFGITKKERLRLYGIDAPEMKLKTRVAGVIAKEYVRDKLFVMVTEMCGNQAKIEYESIIFSIETYKQGKYGRYLAKIFIGGKCLNDELVKRNLAVYKDY